jgi:hypothetical protein
MPHVVQLTVTVPDEHVIVEIATPEAERFNAQTSRINDFTSGSF